MKYTPKKLFFGIAALAVAIAVVIVIIACSWIGGGGVAEAYSEPLSALVDSETVYIMLALWIAVPIGLAGLLAVVIWTAKPVARAFRAKKHVKKAGGSRFANRTQIDAQLAKAQDVAFDSMSLSAVCEGFRHYAAGKLGLYYDIADIRRFVAGMGISKLVILRGISGTGKTSLAYAAGEYFGNPATIVPVQPMWKERSDIVGYFNEFTKRFNETTLLCKLYEAGGRPDVYITVLDEVNISRIEYYFAEFLSLLELPDPKKRELDIVSDSWPNDPKRLRGGKLLLPENMWFIGTANNDDSTFAISDKVYDRAAVIDLDRKSQPFVPQDVAGAHISFRELQQRFAEAKAAYHLTRRNRENLTRLDNYLSDVFRVSFGNRIMRQIEDYVPILYACGGTELEALDDILARKVLRKLEQQSPALLKGQIPGLVALLDEIFGAGHLPLSRDYLDRLAKTV